MNSPATNGGNVDLALLNLKASAAMRDEDFRIARKHCGEASARQMTRANKAAYERAYSWQETCRAAREQAHGRVIRHAAAAA